MMANPNTTLWLPPDDTAGREIPHADSESAPHRKHEQFRVLALAALTVLLIGLCILLAAPFLPAITWGVALAIIAWPLHRWISEHVPQPIFASLLSSAAVVILIVAPSLFVSFQLAGEAGALADHVQDQSEANTVLAKIAETPGLEPIVRWMDQMDLRFEVEAGKVIESYTRGAAGLIQGSFAAVIQFLVAIFILFFLFLDRWTCIHGLRDLLPLSKAESDKVFARAAETVHANLYATVITSLINATGGGLMFWLVGIPAPMLWGVVMFVLGILPFVGAALIWIPAAVYMALSDQWLGGAALVGWGIATFVIVDTILYVRLVGQGMRLHAVPALIAFLGGMTVFGPSGIILGPTIFAVTSAFLEVWKRRLTNDAPSALVVTNSAGQALPTMAP